MKDHINYLNSGEKYEDINLLFTFSYLVLCVSAFNASSQFFSIGVSSSNVPSCTLGVLSTEPFPDFVRMHDNSKDQNHNDKLAAR